VGQGPKNGEWVGTHETGVAVRAGEGKAVQGDSVAGRGRTERGQKIKGGKRVARQ